MSFIHYQVSMEEAYAHLFNVTCLVDARHHEELVISLPAWIPGSYLIRDFAKNIVQIKAFCDGKELEMKKLDKDSCHFRPAVNQLQFTTKFTPEISL